MTNLNERVLELIKTYPTDGTHGYHWVSGFDGSTRDIHYQDRLIMKANEEKQTYCCGLTLEVYLRIMIDELNYPLGDFQDVINLKRHWFCASGKYSKARDYRGPVDALVPIGLGIEIQRQDPMAGDFAQIWRKNGSGHSTILTDKIITNVDYWSTQTSTKGIGYRKEFFEGVNNPITNIYIVRALEEKLINEPGQDQVA